MGRLSCASGCGTFLLDDEVERRLRTNGKSFYCPSGHSQHFNLGPTEDQKTIQRLQFELRLTRQQTERRIATARRLLRAAYGSVVYPCSKCGHGHRFDSWLGELHDRFAGPPRVKAVVEATR